MLEISGTWKTQKSIPFLGSGHGTIAIYPDGFAKGCGSVQFLGKTYRFRADTIQITETGPGIYRGTYLGKSLIFSANSTATVLSLTVNPYRMGLIGIRHLDINIPLQFVRA